VLRLIIIVVLVDRVIPRLHNAYCSGDTLPRTNQDKNRTIWKGALGELEDNEEYGRVWIHFMEEFLEKKEKNFP